MLLTISRPKAPHFCSPFDLKGLVFQIHFFFSDNNRHRFIPQEWGKFRCQRRWEWTLGYECLTLNVMPFCDGIHLTVSYAHSNMKRSELYINCLLVLWVPFEYNAWKSLWTLSIVPFYCLTFCRALLPCLALCLKALRASGLLVGGHLPVVKGGMAVCE